MDLSSIAIPVILASVMVNSTPILLAGLGELVVEKSGVLNLGVEGMMITGAVSGFIVAILTGNPFLGFLAAAAGGAFLSLLFGILTQVLLSNQVATGLALTLFGLGLSAMMGQEYVGIKAPVIDKLNFPVLSDLPLVGRALFQHDVLVYFSIFLVALVWAFMTFTRGGMILRAVGENHTAAHALGYKVVRIRLLAILFGGASAGLGGAYISLVLVPTWTEGMTAGAGWIALAIVVFASWRPMRILIGAYLFGGVTVLQLNLQAAGSTIPVELLSISPYVITILVLVIISRRRASAGSAPADLGKSFHAS